MIRVNNVPSIPEGTPTIIPGINLSLYPLCITLGIIASIITIGYFWKREKYSSDILLKLIIITIPSALIGARLFYIFERLIADPANPFPGSQWYAIWEGGLSIQGGIIVPLFLNLWYLNSKKDIIDVKKAFGIILPTVLIGQAIGRWGNFANHEVYGRITDRESIIWLGSAIADNMFINGEYRQPLFFYEFLTSLIGYIIICWIILNLGLLKPGSTGALYLIWYGIVRTAMEPLREESYIYYTILSILFLVAGVILLIYFEFVGRKQYIIKKVGLLRQYEFKNARIILPLATSSKWINE
ncbi:MAG: prolipoprotein diacylglyceryl transferase [Metamycoplasmataceae bacterium]